MAGFVASQAGNAVNQAIGKSTESVSSSPGAQINWVDFNYPPLVRIVHYDPGELPSFLSGMVRLFHLSFALSVLACFLNLVDTIVIVSSTDAPAKWMLQSALHLFLVPVAALATFYSGYRGFAEPDSSLACRFKVAQPLLGLFYFFMGILPFGCAHGLAEFGSVADHTGGKGSSFWTFAIICESTLFLLNSALACVNVIRASRFDSFAAGAAGRF
mmetsp:Transcript_44154/g.127470  ORF Transcript_44154/g.127470 Transcript_44154/m.127470 type:complete len:215 (-) Transcript_44154:92-736(-)|eukprot:CAMPEP_0176012554 /NCGR_PEP_ID=MMETSP0120_2-20121206/5855_1 /TAXON_ID=160619 /ORGANISM="Kryptoperidinium foliaceum, Strain CCMP 1326" /LENGTH=214 /DNA_ID=CAMNT_0017345443 /DNA_START=85 /DNA_END=729 /DNA_ORIENTATION=+